MRITRWWRIGQAGITGMAGIVLTALLMYSTALATPASRPDRLRGGTPTPARLFEDDFSTYSGRWEVTESPKSTVAYEDERLQIMVVAPGVSVWSVPDFSTPLRDYHIDVSALIVEGDDNAQYGVILDNQDDERFYALLVALTSEWLFLHYDDGEWTDLTPVDPAIIEWPEEDLKEPVQLAIDVIGDTVTLTVNDQRLDVLAIPEPLTGGVFGLIARAEHGYITVAFDDLVVSTQSETSRK